MPFDFVANQRRPELGAGSVDLRASEVRRLIYFSHIVATLALIQWAASLVGKNSYQLSQERYAEKQRHDRPQMPASPSSTAANSGLHWNTTNSNGVCCQDGNYYICVKEMARQTSEARKNIDSSIRQARTAFMQLRINCNQNRSFPCNPGSQRNTLLGTQQQWISVAKSYSHETTHYKTRNSTDVRSLLSIAQCANSLQYTSTCMYLLGTQIHPRTNAMRTVHTIRVQYTCPVYIGSCCSPLIIFGHISKEESSLLFIDVSISFSVFCFDIQFF